MAYTKKTWTSETPITPNELNRIEDGISDIPVIIRCGSKVITATDSAAAELFNESQLKTLFGVSSIDAAKFTGCVSNGNTNAYNGKLIGVHVSPNNKCAYVHLANAVTGSVGFQVNYTLFYQK